MNSIIIPVEKAATEKVTVASELQTYIYLFVYIRKMKNIFFIKNYQFFIFSFQFD